MAKEKTWAYNWRQSPAHYFFLTTFLKPRPAGDDHFQGVNWPLALGEPPASAVERFLVQGVLAGAPLFVRADHDLTRDQVRAMLRERGLDVSGRKEKLLARLIQDDELTVRAALSTRLLQCTDTGRALAEAYLSDSERVLAQATQATADEENREEEGLTPEEVRRLLRWLLVEGIVLGVAGNAAYDALKALAAAAGEKIGAGIERPGALRATKLGATVALEWCYVPAGPFSMGSDDRDPDADDDEKPRHRVYVDAFHVAKYPITNRQYQVFVRAARHRAPSDWENGRYPQGKGDHPVRYVSWSDVVAFCEWAGRRTGVPIRLLTEAEWEKAARGTDGRIYPWGNRWRPEYCNAENKEGGTTPVGRYPRGTSPYGLYDMAGNVWEWTSSLYKPYPYRAGDGREDMQAEGYRVARGGAWYSDSRWARAAFRLHYHGYYWHGSGFRVGVAAPFSPPSVL